MTSGDTSRLYFVSRAEQINGRGPTASPQPRHAGAAGRYRCGDGTGKQRRSVGCSGRAPSGVGMKLRDLPDMELRGAECRSGQGNAPHLAVRTRQRWLDGERQAFDENVVSAAIPMNSEEV